MRMIRSLFCAGLAVMAIGLCAAMPAAAAVPVEVNAIVQPLTAKEYPAPNIAFVHQDVAVLPSVVTQATSGEGSSQSSIFGASHSFTKSAIVEPYKHIDPDIAG
ncbi:hypothetical protein [Rhizobium sp. N324]|uniref:hypothetical protein n=1 Tax=Rhizobium sp. N324 TaxID=1703969 RepID=UPI0007EBCCBC|nr:hypothetical protein [Rhizobium sp. N324]ANM12061.1 hypothetical protein AMK05_CH03712 [Rhizobium sp. N324]